VLLFFERDDVVVDFNRAEAPHFAA
jgi:hypothetical protein